MRSARKISNLKFQICNLKGEPAFELNRHDRSLSGVTREMKKIQDVAAETKEPGAVALARTRQIHRNGSLDAAGTRRQDHDAVAHVDRLVDVVRDQEDGGAARFPKAQHLILHAHARK